LSGPSPTPPPTRGQALYHPASLILRRGRKGEEKTDLIELYIKLFSAAESLNRVLDVLACYCLSVFTVSAYGIMTVTVSEVAAVVEHSPPAMQRATCQVIRTRAGQQLLGVRKAGFALPAVSVFDPRDTLDHCLPGLDVVLAGDRYVFHDRRPAPVVTSDRVNASG